MEFSRPKYWSGWPFFSPGDFPNPGIEPSSPALQVDSLPVELQRKPDQGLDIELMAYIQHCAGLECTSLGVQGERWD